ncbi:MAG: phosphatase PAP2 family protein [Eubacteriales bacterium]|nr:phosphatase PAP2 family protein [Eubacteriales bacterium]
MKNLYNTILPKFSRLPLLIVVVVDLMAYYIPSRLIVTDFPKHDLSLPIDNMIPFVPFFLLFYVLAYPQWIGGFIYNCRESANLCYRIVMADLIMKIIAMMFFIFLPTEIVRPPITGTGLFDLGTQFIYLVDNPVNLFPSLHCAMSWLCFRGAMMMERKNYYYIVGNGVLTILVFASIVFIKQHFFIDIFAGILVAEIGLFLSCKCKLYRFIAFIQTPSAKAQLKKDAEKTA